MAMPAISGPQLKRQLYSLAKYLQDRAEFKTQLGFLYKENHALDAWFNKAYGGKQEIPVSMIELPANCSTARNRDSGHREE